MGQLLIDLHTGKIGGEVGKALMTFAPVILLLLTLSGVYMRLKPFLIRRQNAQLRATTTAAIAPNSTTAPNRSPSPARETVGV